MPPILKQGSQGPDVVTLQQMLHQHGFYGGRIDGDFGWRTHVAVTKYQEAAGLHADGSTGDDTWRSLNSASGPQTGLRAEEHVEDYVGSAYGTLHSSMTAQQRLDQLMAASLQELGELGVPVPDYAFDTGLANHTLAAFRSNDQWHVAVNPAHFDPAYVESLTEQQLGDLANTIYHETRHAELTFRELRAEAGLGHDAASLMATTHVPQNIADAAVATAITQSTADGATDKAVAGYESFYGRDAAATKAVYDSGDYQAYRRLPEENDAFEAGREVMDSWRHHGGIRGTVELHDTGEDVAYLQRALTQLSFYTGIVDGEFNDGTQQAVIAFQSHSSLKDDGVCGEKTWEALALVYAE